MATRFTRELLHLRDRLARTRNENGDGHPFRLAGLGEGLELS